ncbi:hypothetical protein F53441_9747 [Fusarium austroafricanum]|uniref:DNA mismatch repair protein S5 domain-containing protein n=1 Tax=Fusarium austroafricanum TaxID=2364996 RepID=A0A8H4KAW3_9HYPO|nr:hypothetical protein F53441_9747 [Fusarium austroafricanum]
MSISALPPSTAHLLRSSSSLPDPLSLVKELVDNSIDAGAKSIEITVAPNTVDKIHVRDNGCGIQLEDHDFLGRRCHTSKLRNFEELHLKGGTTLGFRGEALASANSLATIKITTRTAKDPVASLLQLDCGSGGISKKQPVSSPVGTTVQALDLFQNLPVRKQNAIKFSRKTLADIRRLLEGYVIALPHLKLSFRVPGSSIQPWVYSPRSPENTREAITQVFGHALASQLIELSSDPTTGRISTEIQVEKLKITASLPRPDSDVKAIKGKGAFISVDSRPISSTRSTGKKLFSIFKSSFSAVLGAADSHRAPPSLFMQLSIQCPLGSYDPNVTSLKDELLFVDESAVLNCFKTLCNSIYSKKPSIDKDSPRKLMPGERTLPPVTRALRTAGPKLRNAVYLNSTKTEYLMTDQELVDSLNDELERVLGGDSGVFGGSERSSSSAFIVPTSPKNARSGHQNEVGGSKEAQTVQQVMRTRLAVNLSRKESDSTDVDGTEGLAPIQITPLRAATPAQDQSQSNSRRRGLTQPRRLGNIDDYFHPARDELIEIATDETATSENIPHGNGLTSPSQSNRPPLKELTESDLNTFQEEEEEEYEDASDDGSFIELPFAEPNSVPSPRTSPRRQAPSLLNQPSRALTRPRQIHNSLSDLQLGLPANLQTPPSSDSTSIDNLIRRESRRQSVNNLSARVQRSSRGNTMPSVSRRSGDELRLGRLPPGSSPAASSGRRRSEQIRYGNGLGSRRNAPMANNRDDSDTYFKEMLHTSHADSEDQEG